jgi:hypothetical protein
VKGSRIHGDKCRAINESNTLRTFNWLKGWKQKHSWFNSYQSWIWFNCDWSQHCVES